MSKILYAWEIGAGLGHLATAGPLTEALADRGHEVVVAARDLTRVHVALRTDKVTVMQAPYSAGNSGWHPGQTCTFTDILRMAGGYDDADSLLSMVKAWRALFDAVAPDVVICDYSPTALLASRGYPMRRVVLGTGFYAPPDVCPLPMLRGRTRRGRDEIVSVENWVLANTNIVLRWLGEEPLERFSQLFSDVDENILMTFKELDHYQAREGAQYWGSWEDLPGVAANWPEGRGPKVFAYLKPCAALPLVLEHLRKREARSLVYLSSPQPKLMKEFGSERLRFSLHPLHIRDAVSSCDLAIGHGGHGTTAAIMLAGKPMLVLPFHLEQMNTGANVMRMRAGVVAAPRKPDKVPAAINRLFQDRRLRTGAERFARKYQNYTPATQVSRCAERIESLAGSR